MKRPDDEIAHVCNFLGGEKVLSYITYLESQQESAVSATGPTPVAAESSLPPTEPQTPGGSSIRRSPSGDLELSSSDPFDAVLIDIVETNRRKRKDYAQDTDIFSNFRDTAALLGIKDFGPVDSALFLAGVKLARLKSLRINGRMNDTANEAVADTLLDLAVYSIIALAISKEEA